MSHSGCGEQLPLAWNSLQDVVPARLKFEARTRYQVSCRTRNQNLVGGRQSPNPGASMHRDATEVFSHDLTFSRVNTGANANAKFLHSLGYRLTAADGARRTIESRYETVAQSADLPAAMPLQLLTNRE
jgi:hypothetical protein